MLRVFVAFFIASATGFAGSQVIDVDFTKMPGAYLGRYVNEEGLCTATLIGTRHILTAKHCVAEKDLGTFYFRHTFDGKYTEKSSIDSIVKTGDGKVALANTANDWAIIKLDRALGETYGWSPIYFPESKAINVGFAGYAGVHNKGDHPIYGTCQVTVHPKTGLVKTGDCRVSPGVSGGPIVQVIDKKSRIVGVVARGILSSAMTAFYFAVFDAIVDDIDHEFKKVKRIVAIKDTKLKEEDLKEVGEGIDALKASGDKLRKAIKEVGDPGEENRASLNKLIEKIDSSLSKIVTVRKKIE